MHAAKQIILKQRKADELMKSLIEEAGKLIK